MSAAGPLPRLAPQGEARRLPNERSGRGVTRPRQARLVSATSLIACFRSLLDTPSVRGR